MRLGKNDTVAKAIFSNIENPFLGFKVTKHFVDRYIERFNDEFVLREVLSKVNKDLCFLIFEAERSADKKVIVKTKQAVVPLLLIQGSQNWYLQANTIYERNLNDNT